jgi:hypothetical protein
MDGRVLVVRLVSKNSWLTLLSIGRGRLGCCSWCWSRCRCCGRCLPLEVVLLVAQLFRSGGCNKTPIEGWSPWIWGTVPTIVLHLQSTNRNWQCQMTTADDSWHDMQFCQIALKINHGWNTVAKSVLDFINFEDFPIPRELRSTRMRPKLDNINHSRITVEYFQIPMLNSNYGQSTEAGGWSQAFRLHQQDEASGMLYNWIRNAQLPQFVFYSAREEDETKTPATSTSWEETKTQISTPSKNSSG